MSGGAPFRTHFIEKDRNSAARELPRGFGPGKPAAGHQHSLHLVLQLHDGRAGSALLLLRLEEPGDVRILA